jgi:hypothetical protein
VQQLGVAHVDAAVLEFGAQGAGLFLDGGEVGGLPC